MCQVVIKNNLLVSSLKFNKCRSCVLGKASQSHLSPTHFKASSPLELIHNDVWGPTSVTSHDGHCNFVFFIDDFSRLFGFFL